MFLKGGCSKELNHQLDDLEFIRSCGKAKVAFVGRLAAVGSNPLAIDERRILRCSVLLQCSTAVLEEENELSSQKLLSNLLQGFLQ